MTPEDRERFEKCPHTVWYACMPEVCAGCSATKADLAELNGMNLDDRIRRIVREEMGK